MKKSIIIINHMRKNLFPFFVVAFIMLFSGFLLTSALGEYNYITAARNIIADSGFENALFFSIPMNEEDTPCIPDTLYDMHGIDKIIWTSVGGYIETDDNTYLNVCYINSTRINIPIAKGRFIDEKTQQPECVLPKKYDGIFSVGDPIKISQNKTATIVGFTVDEYPYPDFSQWGTNAGCDYLFEESRNRILVFDPEAQNQNNSLMAIALISNKITEANLKEITSAISSYGPMLTYDKLMEVTNIKVEQVLRENLPLPVFLLVISFVTMICVVALSINRSMNEHSKYFLIGCTKRESVSIIVNSLVMFFSVPTVINILLVILNPNIFEINSSQNYIVNIFCIVPLIIYLFIVLLISSIIPLILYSTFSPLDFYRRNL